MFCREAFFAKIQKNFKDVKTRKVDEETKYFEWKTLFL